MDIEAINTVDPRGSTVDVERINNQCRGNQHCIYLPDHVFTYGQLYVAFSRVTDPSALAVYLNNPDGIYKKHCVSGSFVTFHVHFAQNH